LRLIARIFYQTVHAIQYIHSLEIAHRDIKPENILLDHNFNVKLCDFGWANFMNGLEPRTSICGTFEYMPPEIVHSMSHTVSADIWSLGILLYELLHGKAPFHGNSLEDIKRELLTRQVKLKSSLSQETKNLIKTLLKQDSQKRLSATEIVKLMEVNYSEGMLRKSLSENEKFCLFKNYFYNKYKIVDENLIRSKVIEESFGISEKEENRKMPLKYNRMYNLNHELVQHIEGLGIYFLKT
jgi:serine/threonine protein kinase